MKLIIPLNIISKLSEEEVNELLRTNGFDFKFPIIVHHDIEKNTYSQEGD